MKNFTFLNVNLSNSFTNYCVLTRTFYYQKNKKQWSSFCFHKFITKNVYWKMFPVVSIPHIEFESKWIIVAAVFHRTIVRSCRPSVFWVTRNRGSLSSVRSRSLVGNLWDRNFLLQIAASSVRCIPANPGQKNARPF